jgi:uncharacterized protein
VAQPAENADQGHIRGQYMLGVMYENGVVVAQDVAEAERLFRKSAQVGYAPAREGLKRLGKR